MTNTLQSIIAAIVIALAMAGLVRHFHNTGHKDDTCEGCPLKEDCGKRRLNPRNNGEAPCDRN